MKWRFHYLIIIIWCLFACACTHDPVTPYELPPRAEKLDFLAIVYIMAENSLSGVADSDISELLAGKDEIPANSKVVIYKDDTSLPIIYQLDAQEGLKVWKTFPEDEDSVDSLVMLRNLKDITAQFPAKRYGLTLWSHGSGWTPKKKTIGVDNNKNTASNTGTEMNISTLRWVLERAVHLDYIFFDACFMQGIEVAYELRDVADWLVGSPAEIPGPGAPYDKIVHALCTGDALGIASGYDAMYPFTHRGYTYPGVLLSAVCCNELEHLASTTRKYLAQLYAGQQTQPTTEFQYYSTNYGSFTYCYDMNTIMYNLLPEGAYAEWLAAFNRAVPLRTFSSSREWTANHCSNAYIHDPEHYGGVSMFVPEDKPASASWSEALHKMEWYTAAGWDSTGW